MNKRSFERDVPKGYKLSKHINAEEKLFGIVLNLVAIVLCAAVVFASVALFRRFAGASDIFYVFIGVGIGGILLLIYTVLHELVHGVAYKLATGERLKFGISWSCAFCGVPRIYVYRKYALIAVLLPVIFFTVILIPLMALCIVLSDGASSGFATVVYYALSIVLGMNIGGSSGDVFLAFLLFFKYRRSDTLIRDTGPEQYIYERDSI